MAQQIPEFGFTIERYALHNSRPEPVDFMWSGHRFTIPPSEVVGSKPAQFDTGEPIPGTLVVQDSYSLERDGASIRESGPPNWSAKEALRNVLGVNPTTNQAESKLALNGISLIPLICSKSQYDSIRTDGNERYVTSLITWAMETVGAYEVARNKAREAGVDPKPAGAEFYKAQSILKMNDEKTRKQLGVEENILAQAAEDDELEFKAFAYAVAEKAAAAAAESYGVDKAKIVERMLEDPKTAAQLRKKYSIRKRGYLDPTSPGAEGAEQPPVEGSEGG